MRALSLFVAALLVLTGVHPSLPAKVYAQDPKGDQPSLKLELRDAPLAVKFVNVGKEPIRILKPLDGSQWCWMMPYYRLTVINDHDREIDYAPRCGNYGEPYSDTKWPDDYLVVIKPGGSYTHGLTHNHNIYEAGRYRLRFEYVFTPRLKGIRAGPYPEGLWRGTAVSNTLETKLEPDEGVRKPR
jgi:hypothetical protein